MTVNLSIEQAERIKKTKSIGTYPTPNGSVKMWYEGDKVVVQHYDADDEPECRCVYNSLDEAQLETSRFYY